MKIHVCDYCQNPINLISVSESKDICQNCLKKAIVALDEKQNSNSSSDQKLKIKKKKNRARALKIGWSEYPKLNHQSLIEKLSCDYEAKPIPIFTWLKDQNVFAIKGQRAGRSREGYKSIQVDGADGGYFDAIQLSKFHELGYWPYSVNQILFCPKDAEEKMES